MQLSIIYLPFEVKTYNGKYENSGDDWFYLQKKKRKILKNNPTIQVKANAAQLAEYLESDFIRNKEKKWVNGIVIMANADVTCRTEHPGVPVWLIQYLAEELGNIPDKQAFSEQAQKEICEKLEKLYKDQ